MNDDTTTTTHIGCDHCHEPINLNAADAWLIKDNDVMMHNLLLVHHWCGIALARRGRALHTVIK